MATLTSILKRYFFIPLTAFIIIYGCGQKNASQSQLLANDVADGKILAKKYCISCHLFSDPSLLDKLTWEKGVLPAMAKQLGLQNYEGQYFTDSKTGISIVEWSKILAYYKAMAPSKLVFPKSLKRVDDMAFFKTKQPQNTDIKKTATTTLVSYNAEDHKIYTGDAYNNLYTWGDNLKPTLLKQMPSPATGVLFGHDDHGANKGIFTCIGVLQPLDVNKGKVISFGLDKKSAHQLPLELADSLPRPVQTVAADFDKDGLMDYAVCGFGHDRGGLYWIKQLPGKHFKSIPIRMISGGTQLITGDFNHDGWPDIMCLFAQADEGIWMFLNNHKGGFESVNVLHFPPIYGSSSFQLVDFNHDGYPDILYTAGDNSDYSRVLKPYHGVYIFLNDGNYHFKQKYFYHINGCTKAMAADFKKDGKLDIAVISFFADLKNNPSEGFVFLEQTSSFQFTPHQMPIDQFGRWLTMDVADYNNDGYPDILLGNFSIGGGLLNQKGLKPAWDAHEPMIVLENEYKRSKK